MDLRADILGVLVHRLSFDKCLALLYDFLNQNSVKTVFTPNAEIVMKAFREHSFLGILNSADLLTPDGIGILIASRIIKQPIYERVSGIDLVSALFENSKKTINVFLLGGEPGVGQLAALAIEKKFPMVHVSGWEHGYFKHDQNQRIIEKINRSKTDLVLVCLGAPKQEIWINDNKNLLSVKLLMGLGGTLDVFSGKVKRAPRLFRKLGLEWFYRLVKQPKRWLRFFDLPKFLFFVLLRRFTG